jgi:hypothetical protein
MRADPVEYPPVDLPDTRVASYTLGPPIGKQSRRVHENRQGGRMNKVLKLLGAVVAVAVLAAGGVVAWLVLRSPEMKPPSTEKIVATPARLARGEYLVRHLVDCLGCHSDHDYDRFGMPIKPGTEAEGGYVFDEKLGVPAG